eukprot:GHUV01000939.1.p1 GENE.GHUV01000939.1~~GHUV01000939.1.p1  ORF type:complete len:252 (+),score=58.73 GHUV01000939.1:177-932(+)
MAVRLILSAVCRRASQQSQQFMPAMSALVQPLQQVMQPAVVPADVLRMAKSSFHSGSALLSSDASLNAILGKELKHEKTIYEKDEVVEAGPPAPFVLHSTMGDTAISLTREYKGEKISVDCSVNLQDSLAVGGYEEGEEEDEGAEADDVNFNVTVTKGDKALVFECISDGSYVDIRHISLEPAGGLDSETTYTGPVFAELDSELQNAFREYITERGINEDLGEFLRHLMFDKEQQEYMHWLDTVKDFVAPK